MQALWRSLQNLNPAWQRDLLLDAVPALAAKYGNLAALAAAQWYEQTRSAQVAGAYEPTLADPYPDERIRASLRSQAGSLFQEGGQDSFASFLDGALQRWVMYSGRETVARNVALDPARPRFARVPTGSKTCAWCEIMSSRGFAYHSERTASLVAGTMRLYHDHCHCQAVAEWDRYHAHITGYDPDAMYQRYQRARQATGGSGGGVEQIARQLRRMYPHQYRDGVESADIATTQQPHGRSGRFAVPSGACVNTVEERAGRQLANLGFQVNANPIVNQKHHPNPDFTIDGRAWELKTPRGSGRNTIDNALKKARRQSDNVILDITDTPLDQDTVERICRARLARRDSTLKEIMIIRDGRLVRWLRRE